MSENYNIFVQINPCEWENFLWSKRGHWYKCRCKFCSCICNIIVSIKNFLCDFSKFGISFKSLKISTAEKQTP